MSIRRVGAAVGLYATIFAASEQCVAGNYVFQNVADNRGALDSAVTRSMNASGDLAILATLDTGADAVLKYHAGQLTTVASEGSAYLEIQLGAPSINNDGRVAFFAKKSSGQMGLYSGADPATSALMEFTPQYGFTFWPHPAPLGNGYLFSGRSTSNGRYGVFTGTNPTTDTLFDNADGYLSEVGPLVSNGSDQFMYYGKRPTQAPSVGIPGLYRGTDPAAGLVADATGPFADFSDDKMIAPNGRVVFSASLDDGRTGIYTGANVATDTVVDNAGPFSRVYSVGIASDGLVAWYGQYRADSSHAIFIGPNAAASERIIGTGDALFGSTVTELQQYGALNDRGDLTFLYFLADGTQGIAITHVPEPACLTAVVIVSAGCLADRRRRKATAFD
jgi:hypothetical protein